MIKAYLKKDFSNNGVCQPLSLIKFCFAKEITPGQIAPPLMQNNLSPMFILL